MDQKINHPKIIQGGMGAGVSAWHMAKAVSLAGELGLVSGVALDVLLIRKLQLGDPGGHIRRALEHFPDNKASMDIVEKYFIPGGKESSEPFKYSPIFDLTPSTELQFLTVAANFVEVWLAKEGHENPVGINYLEKIQIPTIYSIYGSMLAHVDYIIMGAGIPREIPGIMDKLTRHEDVSHGIAVSGSVSGEKFETHLKPKELLPLDLPELPLPVFLPIVSSVTLANVLAKKTTGRIDGFVIEGPTAGGHNAPPRGKMVLNGRGEPVYGERDAVDLSKIAQIGLPFWLAGSYGSPEGLKKALDLGAQGIQVGTAFALSAETGLAESHRDEAIRLALNDEVDVLTDPLASPTGFPFKVLSLSGTLSDKNEYEKRTRICDLGFLRHLYKKEDGTVGYRCPSEPVKVFIKKGGDEKDTHDRKCLCNALMGNIGLEQIRKGVKENALVTIGDDLVGLNGLLNPDKLPYSAKDVVEYLLSGI